MGRCEAPRDSDARRDLSESAKPRLPNPDHAIMKPSPPSFSSWRKDAAPLSHQVGRVWSTVLDAVRGQLTEYSLSLASHREAGKSKTERLD